MSGASAAMSCVGNGPPPLDTQSIVTATSGTLPNRLRGFDSAGLGSCSDGTSDIYGGAAVLQFLFDEGSGSFQFTVNGIQANAGWTTLTSSHGDVLTRISATFSTAGGKSTWVWAGPYSIASNPANGNPTFTFT